MKVTRLIKSVFADMVGRLIAANVLVFVVVNVLYFCGIGYDTLAHWLLVSADVRLLPTHITGLFAYMYTQFNVLHLAYNMLWLFVFGRIYTRQAHDGRRLGLAYMYGGLAGAVAFVAMGVMGFAHGWLAGASAAVLAVVAYVSLACGAVTVDILLPVRIKVRWLGAAVVCLTLAAAQPFDIAQAAAHVGGAFAGVAYWFAVRNGYVSSRKPRFRTKGTATLDAAEAAELQSLLKTVTEQGFNALSPGQRTRLFALSQRANLHR